LTELKDLAGEFPDLSAALNALIARLVDLLPRHCHVAIGLAVSDLQP
jgi:hypothetical protein